MPRRARPCGVLPRFYPGEAEPPSRSPHEFVMQWVPVFVLLWIVVGTTTLAWVCRKALGTLWREPMLKRPVLIVESDDWGAGPPEQAERLDGIATVLGSHADRDGRKAVMTLGLVLGVADGANILANGLRHYCRKSLNHGEFAPVLATIRRGAESGVFALQLHGAEHYWPPALLAGARGDPQLARWLAGPGIPSTEALPAPLQSRWVDASELPSKPLPADVIRAAALAEVADFRTIFGTEPAVAVPPTFVWNDAVEAAWAEAGVQFVVTPGRRYEARAEDGNPSAAGPAVLNGGKGAAGITYVVRDDYFEPSRGHKAERALDALAAKTRAGRPTLLETHRANFLGDGATADAAIRELERLFALTLRAFPDVAFLSTEELALRMRRTDPWLVERRLAVRLHVWLGRLWNVARLRKLAYVTGAIVPAWLLYAATGRAGAAPRASGG